MCTNTPPPGTWCNVPLQGSTACNLLHTIETLAAAAPATQRSQILTLINKCCTNTAPTNLTVAQHGQMVINALAAAQQRNWIQLVQQLQHGH